MKYFFWIAMKIMNELHIISALLYLAPKSEKFASIVMKYQAIFVKIASIIRLIKKKATFVTTNIVKAIMLSYVNKSVFDAMIFC